MNSKSNFEAEQEGRGVSRRGFLKTGTMAAIGVGAPAGLVDAAVMRRVGRSGPDDPAAFLTQGNFAPHLHTYFRARLANGRAVGLTLVDVEDLERPGAALSPGDAGECFSLKFAVSSHAEFQQGTHLLEQTALGQFHLFLAPVDRPGRVLIYEAIINRAWA